MLNVARGLMPVNAVFWTVLPRLQGINRRHRIFRVRHQYSAKPTAATGATGYHLPLLTRRSIPWPNACAGNKPNSEYSGTDAFDRSVVSQTMDSSESLASPNHIFHESSCPSLPR